MTLSAEAILGIAGSLLAASLALQALNHWTWLRWLRGTTIWGCLAFGFVLTLATSDARLLLLGFLFAGVLALAWRKATPALYDEDNSDGYGVPD